MAIAFIRLQLAVALYIMYLILVPYYNPQIMGLTIGLNLVNGVLLVAFFVECSKKKQILSIREMLPFIVFFIATLLMIPLQNKMPISEQFAEWKSEVLQTLIVPLIILNISKYDSAILRYIKNGLFVSMLIAGVYGIVLLFLPNGFNPYVLMVGNLYNVDTDFVELYSDDAGRAVNRIFSTFSHPMVWALCLCFFIIVYINFRNKKNTLVVFGILGLSLFNLLICGVRTGIVSFLITVAYLLYKFHNLRYLTYGLLFVGILFVGLRYNKDYQDYIYSIVDDSKSKTEGSSIEMRLYQWEGVVDVVRGNEVFGNGYRYPSYYKRNFGRHPKAYSFESLLFVVYSSWGVFGFIIWGIMYYMILRNNRRNMIKREHIIYLDSLVLLYFVFSMITGEFNFLTYFALFYSILYAHFRSEEQHVVKVQLLTNMN